MSPDSIQKKMARGAGWMVLLTFADRSLGLVSTLFLARLLAPADFGVVAMALSFIFIAQLISALGFDIALIHYRNPSEDHYHTAWTFNVLFGLLISCISVAAAAPVSDFYNEPAVFWVICSLAVGPLIGGLENIGVVEFRKELDFRREFSFQISRKIVSFLVVVPLALYWRDYWALVVGTLAARIAGTVASYIMHSFRPRFSLSKASALFSFSKWMLFNNLLNFLKERSSDFIIGRVSGPAHLGLYNLTYEFANFPTTEVGAPLNRSLLPGFAKFVDSDEVRSAYSNAMSLLALVAIPAAAGVFAVAPYYVAVVLGQQWLGGVPLMEVLSISSALLVFEGSICAVLIGRGLPNVVVRIHVIFVALLLALLFLLTPRFGILGAAWAAFAAVTITLPLYLQQLHSWLNVSPLAFIRAIVRPALASAVMVAMVRFVLPEYSSTMPFGKTFMWLLVGVIVGVCIYVVVVMTLWFAARCPKGAERHALELVKSRFTSLSESSA
jgi:lipopolysaccharide exporter